MRALFIIHCQDPIYGASRSVSTLIRNLDADVDIIFPTKVQKDGHITPEQIKRYYGDRVQNVWYLPQPARYTILVEKYSRSTYIKSVVKELLYILLRCRYHNIYKKGNYAFIHLNSVILYPMLKKNYPMFLHVRESIRDNFCWWDRHFANYLQKAHGIFFIDSSSQADCPKVQVSQTVLLNPIDQTSVAQIAAETALQRFGLPKGKTVYSIIGNISPIKGVDFAIRAFQKAELENAILLIVGKHTINTAEYERATRELAKEMPNVFFLGEVEEIGQVYRITDYVLRCDAVSGVGRTALEALYSGCGVIIQSQGGTIEEFSDFPESMRQKVFSYLLRNEAGLVAALQKTQAKKIEHREYFSNASDYAEKFLAFINEQ